MTIELRVEADGIEVIGLDPDQVNLLAYVAEMLQHGMTPRIVNVHPDNVAQEWERMEGGDPLTEGDLWEIAKTADEEVENDHHFLDGATESLNDAIIDVLENK